MHKKLPPHYRAWDRPPDWPYDAPGHIYMMRAAEKIGATFGDSWEGIGNPYARRKVLEEIREHCAYGRLTIVAMVYDGTFEQVPSHRWNNFDCWEWFPTCTITNFALLGVRVHPLAGVTHFPLYVAEESLQSILTPAPIASQEQKPAEELRRRRGAQPQYDWPGFEKKAASLLEDRGGFDPKLEIGWNQAALEEMMRDWCESNWSKCPSESSIRDHVSTTYKRYLDSHA